MASGSVRDLIKVLHNTFASPSSPGPANDTSLKAKDLSHEPQQAIQACINKHKSLDENDSQRLHDELFTIYRKHVGPDATKLAAFLHALQLLRPLLHGKAKLQEWVETVVLPVLSNGGARKKELEYATDFLVAILDYGVETDTASEKAKLSNHFAKLLLEEYLKRTRVPGADAEVESVEEETASRQLENALILYGRKKPKDLLLAVDRVVVDKDHRLQALGLLSAFVRLQPPHLYLVSQTPMIEHLLKCLMIDTSSTAISLALSCLIMFLPHIPSSVKTHLPRLFLIYSRLLCWERFFPTATRDNDEQTVEDETTDKDEEPNSKESATDDEDWDKLHSSFEIAESTAPELIHYFTFLYGLYPLNFISYIRKPRRYLKDIKFPRAEDFDLDQTVIRLRTEQFRRLHLMHPNFYTTTAEDELNDNRWLKSDPSDVVSECMSLYIPAATTTEDSTDNAPPEVAPQNLRTEDIPRQSLLDHGEYEAALLNRSSEYSDTEEGTSEVTVASSETSSAPAELVSSPNPKKPSTTHSILAEAQSPRLAAEGFDTPAHLGFHRAPHPTIDTVSNRASSVASLQSLLNQSPHVRPSSRSILPRSPAIRAAPQSEANMAFLQREVMLLRNELNFERYLKQQQLTHIGKLQRKRIAEATTEAETQNLINKNREMKSKLAKSKESYAAIKKEAATARNQSKKWEAELSTRVKQLRDAEKIWRGEEGDLRAEVGKLEDECDKLQQLIVETESRELVSRQEVTHANLKLRELDDFKARINELETAVRDYESKALIYEQQATEAGKLKKELAAAAMSQQSHQAEQNQMKQEYDRRLQELESQVLETKTVTNGRPAPHMSSHLKMLLDNAAFAEEAKMTSLKEEISAAKKRNDELKWRLKYQSGR